MAELEGYITYLEGKRENDKIVKFLEDLLVEHEDQPLLRSALAEQLHRAGRVQEAISQLDILGEALLSAGKKKEAAEVIRKIILWNPANIEDYRQLLAQIQPISL